VSTVRERGGLEEGRGASVKKREVGTKGERKEFEQNCMLHYQEKYGRTRALNESPIEHNQEEKIGGNGKKGSSAIREL